MANDIALGGQLTTTSDIENFPDFPDGNNGNEIMDRCRAQSFRFGIEIFTKTITRVDFSSAPFKVFTDSKTVLVDAVIVAINTVTKRLPFPGFDDSFSEKIYISYLNFFFPSIFPPNFLSLAFFENQT